MPAQTGPDLNHTHSIKALEYYAYAKLPQLFQLIVIGCVLFFSPWHTGVVNERNILDAAKVIVIICLPFSFNAPLKDVFSLKEPIIYAVAFSVMTGVQAIMVTNESSYAAAKELIMSMMFFATLILLRLHRQQWFFLSACLVAGCIIAVVLSVRGLENDLSGAGGAVQRGTVEGINGNHVAYCCVAAAGLVLGLWIRTAEGVERFGIGASVLAFGALGVLCTGIAVTANRGGIVSLIAVACVLIARATKRRQFAVLVCAIAILMCIASALALFPSLLTRFDELDDASNRNRMQAWGIAWELFLRNPIVGIGPGQFPESSGLDMYPHNGFLCLLTELGFPGLLLYSAVVLSVCVKSTRHEGVWISMLMLAALMPILSTGVWERNIVLFSCLAFVGTNAVPATSCRGDQPLHVTLRREGMPISG